MCGHKPFLLYACHSTSLACLEYNCWQLRAVPNPLVVLLSMSQPRVQNTVNQLR